MLNRNFFRPFKITLFCTGLFFLGGARVSDRHEGRPEKVETKIPAAAATSSTERPDGKAFASARETKADASSANPGEIGTYSEEDHLFSFLYRVTLSFGHLNAFARPSPWQALQIKLSKYAEELGLPARELQEHLEKKKWLDCSDLEYKEDKENEQSAVDVYTDVFGTLSYVANPASRLRSMGRELNPLGGKVLIKTEGKAAYSRKETAYPIEWKYTTTIIDANSPLRHFDFNEWVICMIEAGKITGFSAKMTDKRGLILERNGEPVSVPDLLPLLATADEISVSEADRKSAGLVDMATVSFETVSSFQQDKDGKLVRNSLNTIPDRTLLWRGGGFDYSKYETCRDIRVSYIAPAQTRPLTFEPRA
jgi:hypothetical protein